MTDIVNDIDLPPSCPVCAGQTRLKDMRKLPKSGTYKTGSYMCFFHCLTCGTEYPRAVDGGTAFLAGFIKPAPPGPRDGL